ncbi:MAG: 16S rRNA (guanine(966)-N(2))-methyltransferase RsmD [Ruminococcaceae bacterium]|nr:16S rRNA (guanine(966)-N(2))-methyltransferase RsmD [Oscillospiraceae bacterium]
MRVISGMARGTKLLCPEGMFVRPTHDRVKEALFSMLSTKVNGAFVLDLFAGTGALGIEALSRGASGAVFVDTSPQSLKFVEENLQKTHLASLAHLIKRDYLSFLNTTEHLFDLIFLDPPYSEGYLLPALKKIAENRLLKPDGFIYCETEGEPPAEISQLYTIVRDKKYGRARILLLKEMSL